MKKMLTAALTGLALAGSLGAAGSAVADTTTDLGNAHLPSVAPLNGLLGPGAKPGSDARMPAANATVEGLLPGH
ncbi:hypothetical protein ACIPPS_29085 [Streptomyces sp. NPDC090127]|uniref:hypothetical protein n=1 Tax=Streptomyces sp. NPDC090127 TaxID=3365953 RepID=UPI0037F9B137